MLSSAGIPREALVRRSVVRLGALPVQHADVIIRKLGLHYSEGGFHVHVARERYHGEVGRHAFVVTGQWVSTGTSVRASACGDFEGGAHPARYDMSGQVQFGRFCQVQTVRLPTAHVGTLER
jgi:hypothetical protein